MGNVNGREDLEEGGGNIIPSGVEEVDGVDSGGAQEIMAVQQVDGEFMGQSPPSSPRASASPLMFRPEVSLLIFITFGGGVVIFFPDNVGIRDNLKAVISFMYIYYLMNPLTSWCIYFLKFLTNLALLLHECTSVISPGTYNLPLAM